MGVDKALRFTRRQRLVSNSQFKTVLDGRHRVSDGLLVLYVASNTCGQARLGISVGRSYGTAVQRNRIKRLLREAFRISQHDIRDDLDYVVMMAARRKRGKGQTRKNPQANRGLAFPGVRDSFLRLVKRVESLGHRVDS